MWCETFFFILSRDALQESQPFFLRILFSKTMVQEQQGGGVYCWLKYWRSSWWFSCMVFRVDESKCKKRKFPWQLNVASRFQGNWVRRQHYQEVLRNTSLVLLFTECKDRWHSGWFLSPWCARSVCYRHLHIAAIWLWDEHQWPKHIPCHSNTNTIWPLVFISALSEFFWLFIDPSEIVSVGWEWSCMSSQSAPESSAGWHSSTGCEKSQRQRCGLAYLLP